MRLLRLGHKRHWSWLFSCSLFLGSFIQGWWQSSTQWRMDSSYQQPCNEWDIPEAAALTQLNLQMIAALADSCTVTSWKPSSQHRPAKPCPNSWTLGPIRDNKNLFFQGIKFCTPCYAAIANTIVSKSEGRIKPSSSDPRSRVSFRTSQLPSSWTMKSQPIILL